MTKTKLLLNDIIGEKFLLLFTHTGPTTINISTEHKCVHKHSWLGQRKKQGVDL